MTSLQPRYLLNFLEGVWLFVRVCFIVWIIFCGMLVPSLYIASHFGFKF